ncbi:MAG TPA: 3-isopropylmalate dehydrogenase [Xanthomonadales bacterium]|nr:3-isopropylmalate dehydrogenase [Xanthomonadales bacterium]
MSKASNADRPSFRVVALPGDGVGTEVYAVAEQVLALLCRQFAIEIQIEKHLIGGAAVDATGDPLPAATIEACKHADAILLGAVGGPQWDGMPSAQRPEKGLLRLRSEFGLFCNLRPVVTHPALHRFSPLKAEKLQGVDLLMVRELTGGIYFGEKSRDTDSARDLCVYSRAEIERVTRKACQLARLRDGRVTHVDKANVLETSRLWREVVTRVVAEEFADIRLDHMLVDSAAMHLLTHARDFDVLLTENLFGDILSDEASMLCGSMGLLPSASLREDRFGLYEPVHGSAPDIAGKGIANPYAMLLSVALMLRHSLDCPAAAGALEQAIFRCWEEGVLTRDLVPDGHTTAEVAVAVCERLATTTTAAAVG